MSHGPSKRAKCRANEMYSHSEERCVNMEDVIPNWDDRIRTTQRRLQKTKSDHWGTDQMRIAWVSMERPELIQP